MKQFLKFSELTLLNGGYLSNKKTKKPVYHKEFVELQNRVHYIMTLASVAKGKDFVGKQADSLQDVITEVNNIINKKQNISYVSSPEKPSTTTMDTLKEEALAFINFKKEENNYEKINEFLQQFNLLQEVEEYGLFFDEEIVKLQKLYSIEEVVATVKEYIDLLK